MGSIKTYEYDARNRLKKTIHPASRGNELIQYEDDDVMSSEIGGMRLGCKNRDQHPYHLKQ